MATWKPGVVHPASADPLETALKISNAGTRAPGSKNLMSSAPPDIFRRFSEKIGPLSPTTSSELVKALGIFQRTFFWAAASPAQDEPEGQGAGQDEERQTQGW